MRATLTAVACLLLAGAARADVLVPVPVGGGNNPVKALIANAAPGDILLISGDFSPTIDSHTPSDYFDVLVIDKSLTLVGDGGSVGVVRIENLGPDDRVVISGMEVRPIVAANSGVPAIIQSKPGIEIVDCEGTVIVDGCDVLGGQLGVGSPAGIEVRNSADVYVSRTLTRGGWDFFGNDQPPGPGMAIVGGRAAIAHSTLIGASGELLMGLIPGFFPDHAGGAGLVVESLPGQTAEARLGGATLQGGLGGSECDPPDAGDCAGGPGLLVIGPSIVRTVGSVFTGGAPGEILGGGTGAPGEDIVSIPLSPPEPPFALLEWDDVVPEFDGPTVLREGEAATLTIRGEPGELARFYFALDFGFLPLPAKKGVFVPGAAKVGPIALAALPPSGEIEIPLVGPDITSLGLDGVVTTWQAYTRIDGTSELILSNPYELVLLASGF